MERLPADWSVGRDVLLIELTDWHWPSEAGIEWFTVFIAADASGVSNQTIQGLATAMLRQRCASMTAWGPDCESVHVGFDMAHTAWPTHRRVRRWGRWRTTWSDEIPFMHTMDWENESLAYALWCATLEWPAGGEGYFEDRPATFVALVEPQFREEVRGLLLDWERLEREAVADEE